MSPGCHASPGWASHARRVLRAALGQRDPSVEPLQFIERPFSGVFVTLTRRGRLRGCMGVLDGGSTLESAVRRAALDAALHDPRFDPLTPPELADVEIEVSVLDPPVPMRTLDDLQLGRHGVLVRCGPRRGLFLPRVAVDHRMSRETFLSRCCSEKAGLAPDDWRDPAVEVLIFTTQNDVDPPMLTPTGR
jgi:AmmeMemoRadiSam system protein A